MLWYSHSGIWLNFIANSGNVKTNADIPSLSGQVKAHENDSWPGPACTYFKLLGAHEGGVHDVHSLLLLVHVILV